MTVKRNVDVHMGSVGAFKIVKFRVIFDVIKSMLRCLHFVDIYT